MRQYPENEENTENKKTKQVGPFFRRLKPYLKTALLCVTNPRLLLCLGIAWFITNGWSYVMMAAGTFFQIEWMMAVAGAYLAFPFHWQHLLIQHLACQLNRPRQPCLAQSRSGSFQLKHSLLKNTCSVFQRDPSHSCLKKRMAFLA